MSVWATVLVSSALAFALKLTGYLVPERWLAHPHATRIASLLPVALLAGLVAVQTAATSGGSLTLDARAGALVVAAIALVLRAPFIAVVVIAAAAAVALRALGAS